MSKSAELIDEMIARTPDWRGVAFAELRRIIREADPEIVEEVKWKRPSNPLGAPVFEHAGIVCTGAFLKGRVRMALSLKIPRAEDEHALWFTSRVISCIRRVE